MCSCLRVHMCVCAPESTLSLISRRSYRCCSLSNLPTVPLCSATPPGLPPFTFSPETDAYPAHTGQTGRKRSNKNSRFSFLKFLSTWDLCWEKAALEFVGGLKSICIFTHTRSWKKEFNLLLMYCSVWSNLVFYKQIFH